MSSLTSQDVVKLAHLARLKLSDAEVTRFQKELNSILEYVAQLDKVDTKGLKPTDQVTGLTNVTRADVVDKELLIPAELLKNVPSVKDNQIQVKRMMS